MEEGRRGGELENSWEAVDKIQPSMPAFGFYAYLPLLVYPDVLTKTPRAGFLVYTRNYSLGESESWSSADIQSASVSLVPEPSCPSREALQPEGQCLLLAEDSF